MNITPDHTRALDAAKFSLFAQKGDGAFLGALMCNMRISWDDSIPTAQTNGLSMEINPDWFLALPEPTRSTILQHELWHVGHLHPLRAEGMQHRRYNKAADYAINLQLHNDGHTFVGVKPLLDPQYHDMSAEEIYDRLPDDPEGNNPGGGGCWSDDPNDMDLQPDPSPNEITEMVSVVQSATITQQRTGYSSESVEAVIERIKAMNKPKVNWLIAVRDFCMDKARAGLDYTRRNRRYRHIILPARGKRGRLITLDFFMDVSGSVTTEMAKQMMSELIYIWTVLKPKKLRIIQFDTRIRKVDVWEQGSSIFEIEILGRGGTSLDPVEEMLRREPPNGAVIMTDLECPPMNVVRGVPILWLVINNPYATVQQGKAIHIEV